MMTERGMTESTPTQIQREKFIKTETEIIDESEVTQWTSSGQKSKPLPNPYGKENGEKR